MQVGIDSFAAAHDDKSLSIGAAERLQQLIEQIEIADKLGLDVFGVGEHHRREFLDSAPLLYWQLLPHCTRHIRLTSAVTVLSAADPVDYFKNSRLWISFER